MIHTYNEKGQRVSAASEEEMERLRKVEAARKLYDPSYISAEQARGIPQQLMDENPALAARVRESAEHWPENSASASEVLTDLPGGAGETVETIKVDTASLFTGCQVGDEGGDGS